MAVMQGIDRNSRTMSGFRPLMLLLATASLCHMVVGDKETVGLTPAEAASGLDFPPPTPADSPEVREEENTVSGRKIIVGGDDGWTIKPYEGKAMLPVAANLARCLQKLQHGWLWCNELVCCVLQTLNMPWLEMSLCSDGLDLNPSGA